MGKHITFESQSAMKRTEYNSAGRRNIVSAKSQILPMGPKKIESELPERLLDDDFVACTNK